MRGKDAVDCDGVKTQEGRIAIARGSEENIFSVGGPADHAIRTWVIGKAARFAAGGGNYIDVCISIVIASERDPFSVGRKFRLGLHSGRGSDANRIAAIAADGPEFTRVGESDLRAAHRGLLQQKRPFGLRLRDESESKDQKSGQAKFLHVECSFQGATARDAGKR